MFDVRANIREFERGLSDTARQQLPFALSVAANEVAAELVTDLREEMGRKFDRPTRWTLNAFHFTRATKARPVATVQRKLPARGRHYLETEADGGARPLGGWEKQIAQRAAYSGRVGFIIPTVHAPKDAHGNLPRSAMQRILSHIGAQTDASANATAKSRSRRSGAQYFLAKPGGKMRPGVYMRMKRNAKAIGPAESGKPRRVLVFTDKAPRYKARFDFDGVTSRGAARRLPEAMARALRHALATARP